MAGSVNNTSRPNTPPTVLQPSTTTTSQPAPVPAPTQLNATVLPHGGPPARPRSSASAPTPGGSRRSSGPLPPRASSARAASTTTVDSDEDLDSADEMPPSPSPSRQSQQSAAGLPDLSRLGLGSSMPSSPHQQQIGTAGRARSDTAVSNTSIDSQPLELPANARSTNPGAFLAPPPSTPSRVSVHSNLSSVLDSIPESGFGHTGGPARSAPATPQRRLGGQTHGRARSDTAASDTSLSSGPLELSQEVRTLVNAIFEATEARRATEASGGTPESSPAESISVTPANIPLPPSPSKTPSIVNPTQQEIAQADANIQQALEGVSSMLEALSSLEDLQVPGMEAQPSRFQSMSNVPSPTHSAVPLGDDEDAIPLDDLRNRPQSPVVSLHAPSTASDVASETSSEASSEAASETEAAPTGTGAATPAHSAAANWGINTLLQVTPHELVAVGVSTAVREVVGGLIRTAQNNSHASAESQNAIAGAIVALMGVGNLAAMASRRARGTNTAATEVGNALQILGLTTSALAAHKTGELKDILSSLGKTVVYTTMRDGANAMKPYKDTPGAGNPLKAQAWNTLPYTINQFGVNWLQSGKGISGAGIADELHKISNPNATEAAAERTKILKDSALPAFTYVAANTAGEILDKVVGSILEHAVGDQGWAGVAQMAIRHEPMRLPTFSDWGDAGEKTISRMSLFGTVLGTSAATGVGVSTLGFNEAGATSMDNFQGAATVAVMCLPFVMTLMKKARATATGGAPTV